jgi:hypothetical protein
VLNASNALKKHKAEKSDDNIIVSYKGNKLPQNIGNMDPIIIIDSGSGPRQTWTHIINVEDLAEYHNRSVPQLMEYLKVALVSIGTYENRVFGMYTAGIIKTALVTLGLIDVMNGNMCAQVQAQTQAQTQSTTAV